MLIQALVGHDRTADPQAGADDAALSADSLGLVNDVPRVPSHSRDGPELGPGAGELSPVILDPALGAKALHTQGLGVIAGLQVDPHGEADHRTIVRDEGVQRRYHHQTNSATQSWPSTAPRLK